MWIGCTWSGEEILLAIQIFFLNCGSLSRILYRYGIGSVLSPLLWPGGGCFNIFDSLPIIHCCGLFAVLQESCSVPGSPAAVRRRNSRSQRFSWRQDLTLVGRSTLTEPRPRRADQPPPPLVTPCLDNLDLPYADDDPISSTSLSCAGGGGGAGGGEVALRSTSPRRAQPVAARRASTRRQSGLARAQSIRRPGGRATAGSGRARTASQQADLARHRDRRAVPDDRKGEPTHFRWNASVRLKKSRRTSESYNFRQKSVESVRPCSCALSTT